MKTCSVLSILLLILVASCKKDSGADFSRFWVAHYTEHGTNDTVKEVFVTKASNISVNVELDISLDNGHSFGRLIQLTNVTIAHNNGTTNLELFDQYGQVGNSTQNFRLRGELLQIDDQTLSLSIDATDIAASTQTIYSFTGTK